jgi:hypothetical protein
VAFWAFTIVEVKLSFSLKEAPKIIQLTTFYNILAGMAKLLDYNNTWQSLQEQAPAKAK